MVIPPAKGYTCEKTSLDNAMKFVLGVESDEWRIAYSESGFYDGVKVLHIHMEYDGTGRSCPECHKPMAIHDTREREWRHDNLSDTVCYIHAKVPRCKCSVCGKVMQLEVPWAEPKVTYTKVFEEKAIHMMSQMSLAAVSRELHVSWRVLDYIVNRKVEKYLDRMNLRYIRRVRIDETAAKKHHHYITVVTDVDTGRIIFICKGRTVTSCPSSRHGSSNTTAYRRTSCYSLPTSDGTSSQA